MAPTSNFANKAFTRRGFLSGAAATLASLTFSLASGPARAFAGESSGEPGASAGTIALLHTNDVHCGMYNNDNNLGYAAFADYASTQRTAHAEGNVTLVDAGDNLQGGILGAESNGKLPSQIIGACGYEVVTVGNHEFDYGVQNFLDLAASQGVAYACCNFRRADGSTVFDPYHLIDYTVGGKTVKIAYVGAITPSTLTRGDATLFQDENGDFIWGFCEKEAEGAEPGDALVDAVQAAVDDARRVGADYVVLLSHLGQYDNKDYWRSDTVVKKTNGIDIVVDGHSHEKYVQRVQNKDGQDVVIAQTGTKFQSFGHIEIDPATGKATAALEVTAKLIESWDGSDERIARVVADLSREGGEPLPSEKVGSAEAPLYGYKDEGFSGTMRRQETNLGDLVADSLYYACNDKGIKCDFAMFNATTVRANIAQGDILYADVLKAMPYCNRLVAREVTGQHVLDMLEAGACKLPDEDNGFFLHVSKQLSYTIRTDIATPVVLAANKKTFVKIDGERRVRDVKLNGAAIDPEARYLVAGSDYILNRSGSTLPTAPEDSGEPREYGYDCLAFVSYVRDVLGETVGEGYLDANGAGRIKITDHEEKVEPETDPGSGSVSEPQEKPDTQAGAGAGNGERKSRIGVPATGDEGLAAAAGAAAILGVGAIAASGALAD